MKKDIETESAALDEVEGSLEPPTFEDAGQAISQGKRHLLVRDYSLAVSTLAEGVGMLANQHGEMADELAEPYVLYGKALLFLAREEAGILGTGVPCAEEEDEEEDEVEEPDEKDKEKDTENVKKAVTEETNTEADKEKEKSVEVKEKPAAEKSKLEEPVAGGSGSSSAGPSDTLTSKMNGEASTSGFQKNGEVHDNSDDECEDGDDVDGEDDDANSNLRIAWEVLELAKLILIKRGPPGWKLLADTHRLLGEISMEGGNQPAALTDLNACLDFLKKIEPVDPRSMAETHYQLGLAYSLGNDFDASIEQFSMATSLLQTRIKDLESSTEETAAEEIKELKELLPEIQDKITDMKDFKSEAAKLVLEKIKAISGGSCSNGADSSGEGTSSSSSATITSTKEVKQASDISHLVRKKRKQENDEEEEATSSPCKKPLCEKSA
ncbi:histone-binding protein N1/N2 [Phymastichus coffea]|uniref:histone-binding protein N1/N2 n=1 Tax=Phymastichus coffea TaxID=108790 RepID=UPI00273BC065|nr:histone-binding protein N1/N2 [Phymastichus coffea]XP_058796248.1 histone-binding protein N1/N2 [Phymastichus coffea]XP_058796249.1 histone-binding protein N1/N2 [Phymastichus coffea]